MLLLMENAPNVLTRDMMLEKVWDIEGNFIDANALSVNIKRLREKIGHVDMSTMNKVNEGLSISFGMFQ